MAGIGPMGEAAYAGVRGSSPPPAAMETACWIPAIETGKNGRGTATFTLPEQSTQWRLLLKGITVDTLAGEAADPVVVAKDLFGELKLPSSFTDGDQADVIASVHNDGRAKGPIRVTLETTVAGRHVAETKTVEATGKRIQEVAFHVSLNGKYQGPVSADNANRSGLSGASSRVEFVLTVTAAKRQDVAYRSVPLLPYGVPVYATAAGSAAADATAWVELPPGMTLRKPTLSILIGPTVERSLLDALLGAAAAVSGGGRPDRLGPGERHQRSDGRAGPAKAVRRPRRRAAGRGAGRPHSRGRRPALGPSRRRRRLELDRFRPTQRAVCHRAGALGTGARPEGRLSHP